MSQNDHPRRLPSDDRPSPNGDGSPEVRPWLPFASALARWARCLVVQWAAYGQYIPVEKRKTPDKSAFVAKRELTAEVLEAHFSGDLVVGVFSTGDDNRCRSLVVDIDRHGDEGSAEANEKAAIALYDRAMKMGLSPQLEDSNGRGGFKLWLILEEPVPARVLRRLGRWLTRDWKEIGLDHEPEIFPKQDGLADGKLGNFVRLPGRHHTLDHWSRIWDVDKWLEGEDAARAILNTASSKVEVIPVEFRTETPNDAAPAAPWKAQGAPLPPGFVGMLRSAIRSLPGGYPGSYEECIKAGMSLRGLGDVGLELWDIICRRCPKYRQGFCEEKWGSFDPNGKLTYKTILRVARQNGWSRTLRSGGKTSKSKAHHRATTSGRAQKTPLGSEHGEGGILVPPGGANGPGKTDNDQGGGGGTTPPDANKPQQPPGKPRRRPVIRWNDRPPDKVTERALKVYKDSALTKIVFVKGGQLVRIKRAEEGPKTEILDLDALRGILARIATWKAFTGKYQKGYPIYNVTPPQEFVVKDILSLPGWDPDVFPYLAGIVRSPVIAPDGSLVDRPGYHAASRLWYEPDKDLNVPPVSSNPTDDELAKAVSLIIDDLLFDFPFVGPADLANAVGMLMTPFVRCLIDGPTPLMLFDAPVQGTGKGLLAKCVIYPSVGELPATPRPQNEEEWSKTITALLDASVPVVLFDNLTGFLRSANLSAALTTTKWSARRLRETAMVHALINVTWMATANNLELDDDLLRRIIFSRMDAKMERPSDRPRESFKHQDLDSWLRQNRGNLVWAALTIARTWISRSRPSGTQVMGSYESWVKVIGGILQVCGIEGFLGNREERRRSADPESVLCRAFCQAWFERFGEKTVGVKDLFDLVEEKELLTGLLISESEQGRRNKLGRFISKRLDRHYGDHKIVECGVDTSGRRLYKLEVHPQASPPSAPSASQEGGDGGQQLPVAGPNHINFYERVYPKGTERIPIWEYPCSSVRDRLYRQRSFALGDHRAYLHDEEAQVWDFCHALYVACGGWRVVTDRFLIRFARWRGLLPSILLGLDEATNRRLLYETVQEMNYFTDGLLEIEPYDQVCFEGTRLYRYSLTTVPDDAPTTPTVEAGASGPALRTVPRSPAIFTPLEYREADSYGLIADLCLRWWLFGFEQISTEGVLALVHEFNLLPGFADVYDWSDQVRDLDMILETIDGFEFEGFLIHHEQPEPSDGLYVGGWNTITLLEGYPSPSVARDATGADHRKQHVKPYEISGEDFPRLLPDPDRGQSLFGDEQRQVTAGSPPSNLPTEPENRKLS